MNPAKQFWTLFKFQMIANPYLLVYTFAFWAPFSAIISPDQYLDSLVRIETNFLIGFIGVILLAPEMFYSSAVAQWPVLASEFILTRAVDRVVFARARGAGFYFLVLLIPILIFLFALRTPSLNVVSLSAAESQKCLSAIPGSLLVKNPQRLDRITIPYGKVLVAAWRIWACLISAAGVQFLIALIYPFSFRKYILVGLLSVMPLLTLARLCFHEEFFSGETIFFIFSAHPAIFWIETFFFVMLAQLWCEKRFVQQEF